MEFLRQGWNGVRGVRHVVGKTRVGYPARETPILARSNRDDAGRGRLLISDLGERALHFRHLPDVLTSFF